MAYVFHKWSEHYVTSWTFNQALGGTYITLCFSLKEMKDSSLSKKCFFCSYEAISHEGSIITSLYFSHYRGLKSFIRRRYGGCNYSSSIGGTVGLRLWLASHHLFMVWHDFKFHHLCSLMSFHLVKEKLSFYILEI